MPPRRIAVLADSDTRWKWGASVARQIAPEHALDALSIPKSRLPQLMAEIERGVDRLARFLGTAA